MLFSFYTRSFVEELPAYIVEGEPVIFYSVEYLREQYGNNSMCGPWPRSHSKIITQSIRLCEKEIISSFCGSLPALSSIDLSAMNFKVNAEVELQATYKREDRPWIQWKKFATNNSATKVHYGLHYETTSDNEYACIHCERKIKDKSNLYKHIRGHLKLKKFACTICKKSFDCSSNLKDHLNRHPESRSTYYRCLRCDKVFYSVSNVKAHCITHKICDNKRMNCLISDCPRYGLSFDNLLSHVKKAHHIHSYEDYVSRIHKQIQSIKPEKVCHCDEHFAYGIYKMIPSIITHSCSWCSCELKFFNDGKTLLQKWYRVCKFRNHIAATV